jgi:glucose/arabinose dehydrogenase
LGLHPTTHLPFIGDVGWNTWEEINKGAAGANYGWPCWEGNAQQPGYQASFPTQCQSVTSAVVTFPLYTYNHAVGSAVIGGSFFTGTQYPAAYAGNFFFADYPAGWMKRIVFDGNGNVQSVVNFATNIGTVDGGPVAIELGPDGCSITWCSRRGNRPHSTHEWQRVEFAAWPPPRRRPQRLFAAPDRFPAPAPPTRKGAR